MTKFEWFKQDRIEGLIDLLTEARNLTIEQLAEEVLLSRNEVSTQHEKAMKIGNIIKYLNGDKKDD